MRMPWGLLNDIHEAFIQNVPFSVVGTLGTEDRCTVVPCILSAANCRAVHLLQVNDPPGLYPDFADVSTHKMQQNSATLAQADIQSEPLVADLLASDDTILQVVRHLQQQVSGVPVIVDISSMPKRFFCLLLKLFMLSDDVPSIIATYTSIPPQRGYAQGRLALDPRQADHLPGFAGSYESISGIVVSVGFEPLRLESLFDIFSDDTNDIRFIIPCPPGGSGSSRSWHTLMQVAKQRERDALEFEVISAWDAELVFEQIERWKADLGRLALAPFGPKPHTLGMMLSGLHSGLGLYYTQPQVYDPNYSVGHGPTYAYVIKWDGVACFDRPA